MTPELRARIAEVRRHLDAADPTIGYLAPPSLRQSFPREVPTAYQELLREVDGAACGVVMLYEVDGFLQHQQAVRGLPGGRERWFCFGAVEDYPLVIDRASGAVHLIPGEGDFDVEESLGNLDYFLAMSVFGPEYADFVLDPETDPWYQLIRQ